MKNKNVTQKTADQLIDKLTAKNESKKDQLLSLIPEGQSPRVYIDLIKTQVLGSTKQGEARPNEDLMLFLYTAKRTGLDPLAKQLHAVYRWDSRLGMEKMSIQTGIDGFRLVAQRSQLYAGQDDAVFMPEDESTKYPVKASVTVYKMVGGARVPFTATARWSEYASFDKKGDLMGMWNKMPYLMLSKCAEALALRKAFPNELSGLYTQEEMQQSGDILADLPTPEKFEKNTEVKVEHGAPSEARVDMPIGSNETAKVGKDKKKQEGVQEAADIIKMRQKLEIMKERQHEREKENGKN